VVSDAAASSASRTAELDAYGRHLVTSVLLLFSLRTATGPVTIRHILNFPFLAHGAAATQLANRAGIDAHHARHLAYVDAEGEQLLGPGHPPGRSFPPTHQAFDITKPNKDPGEPAPLTASW
jgi:hypothetical protein